MRYKATASVEGKLNLIRGISFNANGLTYEFIVDEENILKKISIWKDIEGKDVEKYRGNICKRDGIYHINMGGKADLEEKIINEFRLLESNLSFISLGALNKINWETIEEEFIPQNEEEEESILVKSFKITKNQYPKKNVRLSEDVLKHYVIDGHKYDELAIPKAFLREGLNYHRNCQYIQAFYNYYFIIEGFYANGKTGEKEVLKEFSKSAELAEVLKKALDKFKENNRHGNRLIFLLKEIKCDSDILGLQKLIFSIRGRVHHFSNKMRNNIGTPFNQQEYESIAAISQYISSLAIGFREVNINKSR